MRRDACYRLIASKADISYTVRGREGTQQSFTGGGGGRVRRGVQPPTLKYTVFD